LAGFGGYDCEYAQQIACLAFWLSWAIFQEQISLEFAPLGRIDFVFGVIESAHSVLV
jgi:hypothetical protein